MFYMNISYLVLSDVHLQ